jgi:hypothetical protein
MTYPELRAAIYAHANELLDDFRRSSSQEPTSGALVFFPEGYREAPEFSDVHFAYYPPDRLALELFGGELPGGLAELLLPFTPGEECPVCVVEEPDVTGRHPVHVHRVTRFHFN